MDKFIKELALGAGKILKSKLGKTKNHQTKSDILDVVTEADLAAEKFIVSRIKQKFPTHQIIAEEGGDNNLKSDHLWIIDPLDGTLNYARDIGNFVTQIAYSHKGKIVLAAVYDPVNNDLYFAKAGQGAFRNGKRIQVSQTKDFRHSMPTINAFYNLPTIKQITKLSKESNNPKFRLRNTGSMGIAGMYVASGRFDYMFSNSGKFWDYAPVYLMIKEAGGVVKTFSGRDWTFADKEFLGGNKTLISRAIKALSR